MMRRDVFVVAALGIAAVATSPYIAVPARVAVTVAVTVDYAKVLQIIVPSPIKSTFTFVN